MGKEDINYVTHHLNFLTLLTALNLPSNSHHPGTPAGSQNKFKHGSQHETPYEE
jgi:hypothetical protein